MARMNCRVRDSRPEVEDADDVIDDVIDFSFILFQFSFIDFEIGLQIESNKFVQICKIQYRLLKHFGTKTITFQNLIF